MSIIDKRNFDKEQDWYTNGTRAIWWDRSTKHWITYLIDSNNHQHGPAFYYPNKYSFQMAEKMGHFEDDIMNRQHYINGDDHLVTD